MNAGEDVLLRLIVLTDLQVHANSLHRHNCESGVQKLDFGSLGETLRAVPII